MDGRERRSRYGTPYQHPAGGRTSAEESMGLPIQDRYTHSIQSPARTDASRASIARPFGSIYGGYDYQQQHQQQQFGTPQISANTMQGVDMQYPYVQEPSRHPTMQHAPAQSHYQSYAQQSMLPSLHQQSMYDSIPFQQRQSAAIEVMASQFSMPSYLPHGEPSSVGASPSQYMTSQGDHAIYTSLAMNRPQLQPAFASHTDDYEMLEQAGQQTLEEAQDTTVTQAEHDAQNTQEVLDQGRRRYDRNIRNSFGAIISGRVTEAKDKLLLASRWLLASIVPLGKAPLRTNGHKLIPEIGLHLDNEAQYEERLTTWRELNHCWEALGLKQRDIIEEAIRTKQLPDDILSRDTIVETINELVSMCDQVENYGLVDYEMGFWEEQIVAVFVACLDLLDEAEGSQR